MEKGMVIMDQESREYLIRMIERECKNYYKKYTDHSEGRYEIAKKMCLELFILTENQIEELENHMMEQHRKKEWG